MPLAPPVAFNAACPTARQRHPPLANARYQAAAAVSAADAAVNADAYSARGNASCSATVPLNATCPAAVPLNASCLAAAAVNAVNATGPAAALKFVHLLPPCHHAASCCAGARAAAACAGAFLPALAQALEARARSSSAGPTSQAALALALLTLVLSTLPTATLAALEPAPAPPVLAALAPNCPDKHKTQCRSASAGAACDAVSFPSSAVFTLL